jgi:hypothetical protein
LPPSLPGSGQCPEIRLLSVRVTLRRRREDRGVDPLPAHGEVSAIAKMRVEADEQNVNRLPQMLAEQPVGLMRFVVVRSAGRQDRMAPLTRSTPSGIGFPDFAMRSPTVATPANTLREALEGHADNRDHQALRHREGIRGSAASMSSRTHLRLARALSQAGKDRELGSSAAWTLVTCIRLMTRASRK